jgi:A/G-specific adenine glycosylase
MLIFLMFIIRPFSARCLRYTASAIASFAYNVNVPVVDGNVCRVLARLRGIANHIKAPILKDSMGWRLAEQLVTPLDEKDKGTFSAGDVNSALMELGASLCSPSGTGIGSDDPLKDFYYSTHIGRDIGLHVVQNTNNHSLKAKQLLDHLLISSKRNISRCKLCDSNGIATVLQKIAEDILREQEKGILNLDRFKCIGHSAFPIAPPKRQKREEFLAVSALSLIDSKDEKWLMVKRPMNGLLAGQWEFPTKSLWTANSRDEYKGEDSNGATSVPTIDSSVAKDALDILLYEVMNSANVDDTIKRAILHRSMACFCSHPIVHVFSHVRHIMWVEHRCITDNTNVKELLNMSKLEWQGSTEKKIRFMTVKEMERVGITAGVKKVLAAIKKERRPRLRG